MPAPAAAPFPRTTRPRPSRRPRSVAAVAVPEERDRGREVCGSCHGADDGPVFQRVVPALADLWTSASRMPRPASVKRINPSRDNVRFARRLFCRYIEHADLVARLDEDCELVEQRGDILRPDCEISRPDAEETRTQQQAQSFRTYNCRIIGYLRLASSGLATRCRRVPRSCPSPPTGVGAAPLRWAHPAAGGARSAAPTTGRERRRR